MGNVFFSIIVAAYNAENKIAQTVGSILSQSFTDYEIVVKDGGSTDCTLSQIADDPRIRVFSERDGGIYDAMNEGISKASGQYLCFLNCGDFFDNDSVLESICGFIRQAGPNQVDVAYGDYIRNQAVFKQPEKLSPFFLYKTSLCHQTMFVKKELFDTFGRYDLRFKICADWCFTVKAFRSGARFLHCNTIVCNYEGGGVSESEKGIAEKQDEALMIRKEFYSAEECRAYDKRIEKSFFKLRQLLVSDRAPLFVRKFYLWLVEKYNALGR